MVEDRTTARVRFAAAFALYFLWVAVLVGLAVFSSTRPMATKTTQKGLTRASVSVPEHRRVKTAATWRLTFGESLFCTRISTHNKTS